MRSVCNSFTLLRSTQPSFSCGSTHGAPFLLWLWPSVHVRQRFVFSLARVSPYPCDALYIVLFVLSIIWGSAVNALTSYACYPPPASCNSLTVCCKIINVPCSFLNEAHLNIKLCYVLIRTAFYGRRAEIALDAAQRRWRRSAAVEAGRGERSTGIWPQRREAKR